MTNSAKIILTVLVIVVVGIGGYAILTQPDNRGFGEKVDDAVEQLDSGVDDAARELQDRTPAERIQDGLEDATDGNTE